MSEEEKKEEEEGTAKEELPPAGEILNSLIKQGAFEAARKYIDFLEAKVAPKEAPKEPETEVKEA